MDVHFCLSTQTGRRFSGQDIVEKVAIRERGRDLKKAGGGVLLQFLKSQHPMELSSWRRAWRELSPPVDHLGLERRRKGAKWHQRGQRKSRRKGNVERQHGKSLQVVNVALSDIQSASWASRQGGPSPRKLSGGM